MIRKVVVRPMAAAIGAGAVLASLALVPAPLAAQSEAILRERFEGRTVTLRIAMPGTEKGVDIHPLAERPLDHPRYAARLKEYGTAIRPGDVAMVTKVKVKGEHIEFQLDGGGYGTFGDDASTEVVVPTTPKTKREQNLEGELKRTTDPARKRAIKEELDDLRREREREDARLRAMTAEAEEAKKANIRQRRLEGGSRFNIRYDRKLTGAELTPESVMRALAEYVDFADAGLATSAPAPAPRGVVRKGMLVEDVERELGPARTATEHAEGALTVVTRTYDADGDDLTAEFVEGVLIRFVRASR